MAGGVDDKYSVCRIITYISGVLDPFFFVGCLETAFPFPTAFNKLLTSLGKVYTRETHTHTHTVKCMGKVYTRHTHSSAWGRSTQETHTHSQVHGEGLHKTHTHSQVHGEGLHKTHTHSQVHGEGLHKRHTQSSA